MTETISLDGLDFKILDLIPENDGVTFAYVFDRLKTIRSPTAIRYRLRKLERYGFIVSETFLDRRIYSLGQLAPEPISCSGGAE